MGNNYSSRCKEKLDIVHTEAEAEAENCEHNPVANIKESSAQTEQISRQDVQVQSENEKKVTFQNKISIHIILPNYSYIWSGNLEDAPHVKAGVSELEWAIRLEKELLKQRASCKWVKDHKTAHERFINLHRTSRQSLPPETVPFNWNSPPRIPPCHTIMRGKTSVYCPGINYDIEVPQHAPYRQTFSVKQCLPHCYYKYKIELEEHYKGCKKCSRVIEDEDSDTQSI